MDFGWLLPMQCSWWLGAPPPPQPATWFPPCSPQLAAAVCPTTNTAAPGCHFRPYNPYWLMHPKAMGCWMVAAG